jgi:hypothetical protein
MAAGERLLVRAEVLRRFRFRRANLRFTARF